MRGPWHIWQKCQPVALGPGDIPNVGILEMENAHTFPAPSIKKRPLPSLYSSVLFQEHQGLHDMCFCSCQFYFLVLMPAIHSNPHKSGVYLLFHKENKEEKKGRKGERKKERSKMKRKKDKEGAGE